MKQQRMLAYGLAEFPMAMATFAMALFIPVFYARDLGLSLAAVAAVLVLARWVDVLIDPLVGYLSDRTRMRSGRRKPWILAGAPIMLLAVIQLFTPRGTATVAGMALWTMVLWIGASMVLIPYHAWGAELSCNYHLRTRIATSRTLCSVAGILAAIGIPLLSGKLFDYGDGLREALTIIAVLAVTTGGIAFTWLLSRVSEPAPIAVRSVRPLEGVRLMWRNGPFKRLLLAFVLAGLGPAMAAPVFFFYLDQVIVADLAVSTPLLVFYFGNLAGVALWGALAERIGKRQSWMAAMWLMVISQPGFLLLGPGDVLPMLALLFVGGASAGSLVGLPCAMQADVIDLDRLASGADRAGLFFSSWSLARKSVGTIALAFPLLILALADFRPSGPNDAAQLWALKVVFAGLPTLCYAGALLVIRSYPLSEERHRHVLRQLAARAPVLPAVATRSALANGSVVANGGGR